MPNNTLMIPSDNPDFTEALPLYTPQTVVHPDTFNPVHQVLLDNDQHLRLAQQAQAGRVDTLLGRVEAVEQVSAVDIARAVDLDWLYRGNRIAIEFFTSSTTLAAHEGVEVVSGIAGDDSIDLASTAGFAAGSEYLLLGADGMSVERLRVAAVLNGERLRFTSNMSRNYGPGARLVGSTMSPRAAGGVTGHVGAQWITSAINLGESVAQRAVVVRRSVNAGEVRLFYRDAFQREWSERFWSNRRAGGVGTGIPAGFADYEYIIPLRGDGYLRAEIAGEPVDILHIVAIGSPTGLGGSVNPQMRPNAASIVYPALNAIDVLERPTVQLDDYTSPAGNAQAAMQLQISASAAFGAMLHDSGAVPGLSYAVPQGVLPANTKVYVRARVIDVAGLESEWVVSSFTTKVSYAYVNTPAITSPTQGQTEVPEQPTVMMSAFAAVGGEDVHSKTQVQVRTVDGQWSAPLYDSGELGVVTQLSLPAGMLQPGQRQYLIRARYKGQALGWSEWSAAVAMTTKQLFAAVLGIVLSQAGGGSGTWQRVDDKLNAITTSTATFSNHPVYSGIVDQIIDGQSMVKVPKFYVRTLVVDSGAYMGKQCWLLSDKPATGFELHPAFKKPDGSERDCFWVGKYQASHAGNALLQSKSGAYPAAAYTPEQYEVWAQTRNVSGVTGFDILNIHQLNAIKLLALIEMGGSDSQALIGQGNMTNDVLAVDNATVAQATWRGIVGLWGNIFQAVKGVKIVQASNKYYLHLHKADGSGGFVDTGVVAPAAGYPAAIDFTSVAGFEMAQFFLPATTTNAISGASIPDFFYHHHQRAYLFHGGCASSGSTAGGLFFFDAGGASVDAAKIGTRLSKV